MKQIGMSSGRPQRGNVQVEDVEAVEEIRAELVD